MCTAAAAVARGASALGVHFTHLCTEPLCDAFPLEEDHSRFSTQSRDEHPWESPRNPSRFHCP